MTDTQKRIMYFWIGFVVAYVLPLFILSLKYDLLTKYTETGYKTSFWVTVAFIFLIINLWSSLKEFIESMNYTVFREVLLAILKTGPYILLLGSAFFVKFFAEDFVFTSLVIALCQLAATPIKAMHSHYNIQRKVARGDVRGIR